MTDATGDTLAYTLSVSGGDFGTGVPVTSGTPLALTLTGTDSFTLNGSIAQGLNPAAGNYAQTINFLLSY
jgi:spore coat protein U-like protein